MPIEPCWLRKTDQSITRRRFGIGLLANLALQPLLKANALTVRGVRLGVQTYSFHKFQVGGEQAVAEIAAALKRLDVQLIELFAPQIEPFPTPPWSWQQWPHSPSQGASLRKPDGGDAEQERIRRREWRIHTPDSYFLKIRAKFAADGVQIYCYNYSFEADMSDAEIDAGFRHARLLGATYLTSSSVVSMAQRVIPFAERNKAYIGWHNHADLKDPDAICTPASLSRLMKMSPFYKVNLDIGYFTTAGFDPVAFIKEQHANITNLHMKDRLKDGGENRPFGMGETNIAGVLRLLRDAPYDIPAFVEYEYFGHGSPEEEIGKALQFETRILQS